MSFFYYLGAAADSAMSVFGIRAPYEHPKYHVVGQISDQVEIRAYAKRVAVETAIRQGNEGEAFGRLFRYIAGANQGATKISMTVPVEMTSQPVAMTVPADLIGGEVMRLFLPKAVARDGPPVPTDALVHVVTLPPGEFAVLRFSGSITPESRREHQAALVAAVTGAGKKMEGAPSVLEYDPPFALPFVRRNEVAVKLAGGAGQP
jgi:hypothetical protein